MPRRSLLRRPVSPQVHSACRQSKRPHRCPSQRPGKLILGHFSFTATAAWFEAEECRCLCFGAILLPLVRFQSTTTWRHSQQEQIYWKQRSQIIEFAAVDVGKLRDARPTKTGEAVGRSPRFLGERASVPWRSTVFPGEQLGFGMQVSPERTQACTKHDDGGGKLNFAF